MARATVTRRLCTIAGFYKYAVEEELIDHSPAAHVRWPRVDYESHVVPAASRPHLRLHHHLHTSEAVRPPRQHLFRALIRQGGPASLR